MSQKKQISEDLMAEKHLLKSSVTNKHYKAEFRGSYRYCLLALVWKLPDKAVVIHPLVCHMLMGLTQKMLPSQGGEQTG